MPAPPSTPQVVTLAPDARAPAGVLCRRCGYDLRGADLAGSCPECGTAVALSARPDLLRFADPAWVATLARGIRFILWGTLVTVLATAGGMVAFGDTLLGHIVSTAGGLVHLYGAWLLTMPNPSTVGRDPTLTDRKVVRVALAASLAGLFLRALLQSEALPNFLLVALVILHVASRLARAVGEFAKFRYLAVLADRVPDGLLARRGRQLSWWFAGCILALAVGGGVATLLAAAVPPGEIPPAVSNAGAVGAAGVGILLVVVTVWTLFVQYRMGKAFRAQAVLAREGWAAGQ
jgi:hypothetical protein